MIQRFTASSGPKLFRLKLSYALLLVPLYLVGISMWPAVPNVIPACRKLAKVKNAQNGFIGTMYICFSDDGQIKPKVFVLEASEPMEKWEAVQHAMESLPAINLTIWYDFGGLQLETVPENGECRMTLRIEGELTENEQAESFSCLVNTKQLSIVDLVRKDGKVRNAPPDPLPEPLNTQCTATPK